MLPDKRLINLFSSHFTHRVENNNVDDQQWEMNKEKNGEDERARQNAMGHIINPYHITKEGLAGQSWSSGRWTDFKTNTHEIFLLLFWLLFRSFLVAI